MPKNDAPKPRRPLPQDITPAVAQAVLEDAMLEAAADIAALSATLGVPAAAPTGSDDALSHALPVPETPEEEELMDLLGVPHLGPVRRQLLADAGIETVSDLEALSSDALAGIKGIGLGNARRIKTWLAERPDGSASADAPSTGAAPAQPASQIPMPPPPMPPEAAPAPAAVQASVDRPLAVANQDVQELFGRIDRATQHLKPLLSLDGGRKRLERQLAKLDTAASELAEGPDTLTAKQMQKSVRSLEKIAALLEAAASAKRLSPKKQEALTDTLREHRKDLEKALGE